MDAGLLLQYVVIALAVLASLAYVVRRQFPGGVRRARIACAVPLVREGRAPWLRRIGLWIAPPPRGGGGGDDGCGTCKSCKP
ncbi:MAG: DUF6587 family protein [Luteimonas sp.]